MILTVRVIPHASRVAVQKNGNSARVYLTRPAQDGQANKQLVSVLADAYGVKKYQVEIIKGQSARSKVIRISDDDEA